MHTLDVNFQKNTESESSQPLKRMDRMDHMDHIKLPVVLLLAEHGQLGSSLKAVFQQAGFTVIGLSRADIDFSNQTLLLNHLQTVLRQTSNSEQAYLLSLPLPLIVINAAAYTAVDKAETDALQADLINHQLPKTLAVFCAQHNALLIHYSTDYVFDGNLNTADANNNQAQHTTEQTAQEMGYLETHATAPLNVYGKTKLLGEQAIQNTPNCGYFIFRTAWVFDGKHANFLTTMLKLAKTRTHLKVVNDQYGVPNSTHTLSQATLHAVLVCLDHLNQAIGNASAAQSTQSKQINWQFLLKTYLGLYHLSNFGMTSWHAYAQAIFETYAIKNILVEGIPAVEYPTPAVRPYYSVLNAGKFARTFNYVWQHWQHTLVDVHELKY